MHRVFVYGTLRKGEVNHHLMATATFISEARTESAYTLVDLGWHPAMIKGGTTSVVGEIYEVDGQTLEKLDELEEVPTWYTREDVQLRGDWKAEAYFMRHAPPEGKVMASGDWCRGRDPRR